MPSWGPRLSALRAWQANVRIYWHLYPLWSVIHETFADKDLDPPQGLTARVALRDLSDWRLPRRLALIWDCMLELQPYRDADLDRSIAASGESGNRGQRAAAEAAIVLAALAAYRQNQRQGGPSASPAPVASPPHEAGGRERLSSELDWLVAVARAVRRRPARMPEPGRTAEPGGQASRQ
jgi:hypothetical protein